jgi:hypothetical protein
MVSLVVAVGLSCGGSDGKGVMPSAKAAAKSGGSAKGKASADAGGSPADAATKSAGPGLNTLQAQSAVRIPAECQGFPLEGLQYSPGGDVLPNKCMPFDATTNNPYAVRCIDAMPAFKTPFPGDQFCILPPPPDQGVQVGLHPQGDVATYWKQIWAGDLSGYDNPPAEWVLMPGDEVTQNYRGHADNAETLNYYRTYFRMRTGSHHNIITMHNSSTADGWIEGSGEALPGFFDPNSGPSLGVLGGQQRPDDSTPQTLSKPPEDDGMYLVFPAKPSIIYNMHHFNVTDGPVLREGWANLWHEPDARTLITWYMGLDISQYTSLAVQPGTIADLHYSWNVPSEMRLIRVFGHRHVWTSNFSTWIERADGTTELAYQSYDWFNMPTYRYDSQVQNPPLHAAAQTDGAISDVVPLHTGDKMHFNCHVDYTDSRQAQTSAPKSPEEIGTLHFANEAFTGEMCIQFGNVSGGSLGVPSADASPIPDFAKLIP